MLGTERLKDNLTCPGCGHSLATAKTIGKGDDVAVACPQCKEQSSLGDWRTSSHPGVSPPEPNLTANAALSQNGKSEWSSRNSTVGSRVVRATVALVGLLAMVTAGLICVCATMALVASFFAIIEGRPDALFQNEYAPGKTANEIQLLRTDLAFFRNLAIAVIAYKACKSLLTWMNGPYFDSKNIVTVTGTAPNP